MKDRDESRSHSLSRLRQTVELGVGEKSLGIPDVSALTREEVQRLMHELQVHQIELEAQNEELRRAQQALEASRDDYSELYDFAPVGYFTLDHTGVILQTNLTGAGLLGIERDDLVGKPLASFVNEQDGNTLCLHFRQALEAQSKQTCEVQIIKKDGSQVSVSLESQAMRSRKGWSHSFRTVAVDTTRRKQVEEDLNCAEELLRRIVDNMPMAVFAKSAEDHRVILWNKASENLFGLPRDEVIGKNDYDFFPEEQADFFWKKIGRPWIPGSW